MLEFLRDPIWQFIGAALVVIGIGTAFWIYWLQRQTKELAFGIVSSRRVLSIADELSARVTVELDGKAVKNLHLLVYGMKNSGHRAVSPSDFQRPLSISFSEGQVVSAAIASQEPSNLGAALIVAESSVELQPLLLNAGDKILLQILLSAQSPSASVDTRILDVPALVPINTQPSLPPFLKSGVFLMVSGMGLVGFSVGVLTDNFGVLGLGFRLVVVGLAGIFALYLFIVMLLNRIGPTTRRYISET